MSDNEEGICRKEVDPVDPAPPAALAAPSKTRTGPQYSPDSFARSEKKRPKKKHSSHHKHKKSSKNDAHEHKKRSRHEHKRSRHHTKEDRGTTSTPRHHQPDPDDDAIAKPSDMYPTDECLAFNESIAAPSAYAAPHEDKNSRTRHRHTHPEKNISPTDEDESFAPNDNIMLSGTTEDASRDYRPVFPGAYREGQDLDHDEENTLATESQARSTGQAEASERTFMAVAQVVKEPELVISTPQEPSGWWSKPRNRFCIIGVVMLLLAGLVTAVVVSQTNTTQQSGTGGDETGGQTNAPTLAPPTGPCYTSLEKLDQDERNATDINVVRNYVLCAYTTFSTGYVNADGEIILGGKPLTLRKHMHIYCGEIGGSSDYNCVITRGSFGLTSIPNNFDPPTYNSNVLVQGLTFKDTALYGVLIGLAGSFRFVDCIFSVSLLRGVSHRYLVILNNPFPLYIFQSHQSSLVPILIEWDGRAVSEDTVGGNTTGGGVNGTDVAAPGGARKLDDATGRYNYSPLQNMDRNDNRNLQTSTILKVDFIDCVFKVRAFMLWQR